MSAPVVPTPGKTCILSPNTHGDVHTCMFQCIIIHRELAKKTSRASKQMAWFQKTTPSIDLSVSELVVNRRRTILERSTCRAPVKASEERCREPATQTLRHMPYCCCTGLAAISELLQLQSNRPLPASTAPTGSSRKRRPGTPLTGAPRSAAWGCIFGSRSLGVAFLVGLGSMTRQTESVES